MATQEQTEAGAVILRDAYFRLIIFGIIAVGSLMFRAFIFGIIFTIILAVGVGYLVLRSGLIPANADAKPGRIEKFIAGTSLRATLEKDAPKESNPVQLTDDNLVKGIKLYETNCAICHGTAEGESSASPISKGEYPGPPQLASEGVEDDPEGSTFWKIKHGIRWTGMPAWKDELSDQEIWTLTLFLKHMDKLPPGPEATWRSVKMPKSSANPH